LSKSVSVKYRNFYAENLSSADVVCVFLGPDAMKKLSPKFKDELKPGCRIVSYCFSLPGWQPKIVDKPEKKLTTIYLYQK
jgi:hypothetical protein